MTLLRETHTPKDGYNISTEDADLAIPIRVLFVGGAGTGALRVTTVGGTVINYVGLTAGTVIELEIKRVSATGTGVTSLIGYHD